jgi:hypothetical protein
VFESENRNSKGCAFCRLANCRRAKRRENHQQVYIERFFLQRFDARDQAEPSACDIRYEIQSKNEPGIPTEPRANKSSQRSDGVDRCERNFDMLDLDRKRFFPFLSRMYITRFDLYVFAWFEE